MNSKFLIAIPLSITIVLTGCAPPSAVGFNGHSVTVRTSAPQNQDKQAAAAEASRVCGQVGKQAQYASTTYVHDLNIQHLFLCI